MRKTRRPIPRPLLFALTLAAALLASTACERSAPDAGGDAQRGESPRAERFSIRGTVLLEGEEAPSPLGTQVFCAGSSHAAWAAADGAFVISDVPPGEYVVHAARPGFLPSAGEPVELRAEAMEDDGALELRGALVLRPDPAAARARPAGEDPLAPGILAGSVELAGRDAASGVRVALAGTRLAASTDAHGEFLFAGVDPGDYVVTFEREGYVPESAEVTVLPNQITRLREIVEMTPEEMLLDNVAIIGRVLVLDALGAAVDTPPGIEATLVDTGETVPVGPEGNFAFTDIPRGVYTLSASAPGFVLEGETQVRVDSEPGVGVLVLRAEPAAQPTPAIAAVVGRVLVEGSPPQPASGFSVSLPGSPHAAVTGPGGAFRFEGVAAGAYAFLCREEGYEDLMLDGLQVEAGRTLDLGDLVMRRKRTPPRVVATVPADGASDVLVAEEVVLRIAFSEPMRFDSVAGAISIEPACNWRLRRAGPAADRAGGDLLDVVVRNDDPATLMQFKTRYRVNVAASATDVEGERMESPYAFSFRTGGLRVLRTRPADGARGIQANFPSPVLFTFNGRIDPDSVGDRAVRFRPQPYGRNVDYPITPQPATGWSVLAVSGTWAADETYTITLDTRIRTEDGERLDEPYSMRFTTAPAGGAEAE